MARPFPSAKTLVPTLAFLVGVGGLQAEDSYGSDDSYDDEIYVTIRDFRLTPMANLRYAEDRLTLHPKASISAGYDSNVNQTADDEEGGSYGTIAAGVQGDFVFSELATLNFDFELFAKQYADSEFEDNDAVGGRLSLGLVHRGLFWESDGNLSMTREDDPTVESGIAVLKDIYSFSYDLTYAGYLTKIGAGVDAGRTDYQEDGLTFNEDERDQWTYGASIFAKRVFDGGSNGELRLRYGVLDYDENFDEDFLSTQAEALLVNNINAQLPGFSTLYTLAQDPRGSDNINIEATQELLVAQFLNQQQAGVGTIYSQVLAAQRGISPFLNAEALVENAVLAQIEPQLPGATLLYRLGSPQNPIRNDNESISLTASLSNALSDSFTVFGSLGLTYTDNDTDYQNNPEYDDKTILAPSISAGLNWAYGQGSLGLSASHGLVSGNESNSAMETVVSVDWFHSTNIGVFAFANASYTGSNDTATGNNLPEYNSDLWSAKVGLGYFFRRGIGIRGSVEQRAFEANRIDDEYDQTIFQLDLAVAF
jgi:hypothetical protein